MPSSPSPPPNDPNAQSRWRETVGNYLPDLILGANDGVITTIAVITGVEGASLSSIVILIMGFANLIGDGISMGASNLLSRRSDPEFEPPSIASVRWHGIATFLGFVLAGVMPLWAYLLPWFAGTPFVWAVTLGLATLFAVGAARSAFTKLHWFAAGIEMLVVGAVAGAAAYGVGAIGAALIGRAVG